MPGLKDFEENSKVSVEIFPCFKLWLESCLGHGCFFCWKNSGAQLGNLYLLHNFFCDNPLHVRKFLVVPPSVAARPVVDKNCSMFGRPYRIMDYLLLTGLVWEKNTIPGWKFTIVYKKANRGCQCVPYLCWCRPMRSLKYGPRAFGTEGLTMTRIRSRSILFW